MKRQLLMNPRGSAMIKLLWKVHGEQYSTAYIIALFSAIKEACCISYLEETVQYAEHVNFVKSVLEQQEEDPFLQMSCETQLGVFTEVITYLKEQYAQWMEATFEECTDEIEHVHTSLIIKKEQ